MSLDYWDEQGWIESVEMSADDLRSLIELAQRNIEEALNSTHSSDWKFNILYAAIINLASCALRVLGYRARAAGSHFYLIESLEFTAEIDRDTISLIQSYRMKRNIATYEIGAMISESEAAEIEEVTTKLLDDIQSWIRKTHSDLM